MFQSKFFELLLFFRKGRLPPKDRAEIAKQSSSLAATMCASNKLAFPKTNQTTRYRSLAKKIMSLSKRITDPHIMAEATKKMEDLVKLLRAGAQKEERVLRMEKRAKEPSVLQSTTLERPLPRKRKRIDKETSKECNALEGQQSQVTQQSTELNQQNVAEQNKEPNRVVEEVNTVKNVAVTQHQLTEPSDQRQQVDLVSSTPSQQQIMFQSQTQGLVEISLPLPETPQIPLPLGNHGNNQGNPGASSILQRILQSSGTPQVSVLPQETHYQAVDGSIQSNGQVMVQVDPRLTGYAANR